MDKSMAQGFDIQQNSVLSSMNYVECILQQGFTIIVCHSLINKRKLNVCCAFDLDTDTN